MATKAKTSSSPLIWLALLATLGLVYWQWSTPELQTDELTVPTDRKVFANQLVNKKRPQERLGVAQMIESTANDNAERKPDPFNRQLPDSNPTKVLFSAHEWLPPPVEPPPPPPPETPPMPYHYVGSVKNIPGGDLVILMQQMTMIMPKLGTQIDTEWRLEREDTEAVYFTYMPLNTQVVLSKKKTTSNVDSGQAQPENYPTEEMLNQ